MERIAIYFINDEGNYYIENTSVFTGEYIPETDYKHIPTRIIDESIDWRNYERTKQELANPTTKDGEIFVVVQPLK